jgi:two-component system, OmpR family, alkaline phosphatase synthesis response regulator PhoP
VTRVVIIEDNESLAQGLRANLEFEGYAVACAANTVDGLAVIAESPTDLIVLDLMLPDGDGYSVLRELRARGDETPVLILSALGDEADKIRGFRFGADDYVTKPFSLLELIARVDALLRRSGRARGGSRPWTFGDVAIDPATRIVRKKGVEVAIRPREYELLVALLRRDGQLATRSELMREVWGYDDSVMSRTVDTHVLELRRKLENDPANPRHILTVLKAGYRLSVDPV